MSRKDDPYLEVYWRLAEEYPEVWDDDRALAWYLRLLKAAEASWPTAADIPVGIPSRTWALLVTVELVIPDHGGRRYRIRGLDKKRNARSSAASTAARSRWRNATGNADSNADSNAESMPHKQSRALPPNPLGEGDPNGTRRASGTNPRAVQAKASQRLKAMLDELHLRYQRHEITEDEWKQQAAAVRSQA